MKSLTEITLDPEHNNEVHVYVLFFFKLSEVSEKAEKNRPLSLIPSIIVTSESSPTLLSAGHIGCPSIQHTGGSVKAASVTVEPPGID